MTVRCINDSGWSEQALQQIKNFPVKDEIYTVVSRNHTLLGAGYILAEIDNPPLADGNEVGFSVKRFVPVDENTGGVQMETATTEHGTEGK